jgi:hypothetical protein
MRTMQDAIMEINADGQIHVAINMINQDSIHFKTVTGKETSDSVILYFTNDIKTRPPRFNMQKNQMGQ